MRRLRFFLLPTLLLAGCGGERAPEGPIRVSIIAGEKPDLLDGRGLVRLEADGQVAPDIAVRWAILDDGRGYIFRIDDGIAARDAAAKLRAALKEARRSAIGASLAGIDTVAAVTPTVVEVRLFTPVPELLALLARPELRLAGVAGPMRAQVAGDAILLTGGEGALPPPVIVHRERAGKAVVRFLAGGSDMVLGGRFDTLAVVRAGAAPAAMLRFDPVTGLFGFAPRSAVFAEPEVARALSLAIDRDRIVRFLGVPRHPKATTIGGATVESALATRIAEARALIGERQLAPRVALPEGPGAGALFRLVQQDWRRIGVEAVRVAPDARADLVLVDQVAPPEALGRIACGVSVGCDPGDAGQVAAAPFVPIAAPVRWSLVGPRLTGFVANAAGAHPLDRLIARR